MRELGRRSVWSLLQVSRAVARRFEEIPSCWVEAEVANLRAGGRQVYFTLTEGEGSDACQLDASMNAIVYERLPVKPENGALVQAYGRVEYWMGRNQVRLRVERLELSGDGLLRARIEELARQLEREGLTDPARKRPLPFLPRRIGLVTSGDGAARADVMTNLQARFPGADVCIVNALVQGPNAPTEIARAIGYLDAQPGVDVIIVARGGGSLEDLMAFNSETVCRAVAASATPIVSAVGHETDVTVCDLVADLRVSTPTKAAEAVVPDSVALRDRLTRAQRSLDRDVGRVAVISRQRVTWASGQLVRGLRDTGGSAHSDLAVAARRLAPAVRGLVRRSHERLARQHEVLRRGTVDLAHRRRAQLDHAAGLLGVLSPERTVDRGYAIVRRRVDGSIVTTAAGLATGDAVAIRLRGGEVAADIVDRTE